jgi:hypothetical protein
MAAMPKGVPIRACRHCGRPAEYRGQLTLSGYHIECAEERQRESTRQLVAHDGPWFDHWRNRCRAAFGVNLTEHHTDTERVAT